MPDLEPHKRKRDVDDHGRDTCHHTQQVVALQQGTSFAKIAVSWMGFAGRPPLWLVRHAILRVRAGRLVRVRVQTALSLSCSKSATLGFDEGRTAAC
jgi:hypothetical protein